MTQPNPHLTPQLDAATEAELNTVLDLCIRKSRFEGWERGKEQVETPTKYTLGDESYPKELFAEAKAALARLLIRERVEEIRQNYGSVLEVIQERKGDPDLMWHEILHPLVEREAQLQAQLEKEGQGE